MDWPAVLTSPDTVITLGLTVMAPSAARTNVPVAVGPVKPLTCPADLTVCRGGAVGAGPVEDGLLVHGV